MLLIFFSSVRMYEKDSIVKNCPNLLSTFHSKNKKYQAKINCADFY
jgi:hypothetical protein